MKSRKEVQNLYIRICKDSGFGLDAIQAAVLCGKTLEISPAEVWIAIGSFNVMEEIAKGEHPAVKRNV